MSKKRKAACLFIALLMMLLFNFPVLSAVNRFAFSGSFPDVFLYLYIFWGCCIAGLLLVTIVRKPVSKDRQ